MSKVRQPLPKFRSKAQLFGAIQQSLAAISTLPAVDLCPFRKKQIAHCIARQAKMFTVDEVL